MYFVKKREKYVASSFSKKRGDRKTIVSRRNATGRERGPFWKRDDTLSLVLLVFSLALSLSLSILFLKYTLSWWSYWPSVIFNTLEPLWQESQSGVIRQTIRRRPLYLLCIIDSISFWAWKMNRLCTQWDNNHPFLFLMLEEEMGDKKKRRDWPLSMLSGDKRVNERELFYWFNLWPQLATFSYIIDR